VEGGGIQCVDNSSLVIKFNLISGNSTTGYSGDGGGIFCSQRSNPTITNNIISRNLANDDGGGICCCYYSSPTIENNFITQNSASDYGGGFVVYNSANPVITNCTISINTASNGGGIHCTSSASPTIKNCILWDDTPQELYGGNPIITYSDIQGGWSGEGNIDADPLFIDPENDDFHLSDYSSCIDRGTDEGAPEFDFEGDSRWDHPDMPNDPSIVDMGADEFAGPEINKVLVHLNIEETQVHRGDEIQVNVFIQTNFQKKQDLGQFWMMVTLPNQKEFGPIYGPYGGPVEQGYHTFDFDFPLIVPTKAPFGMYELIANAGLYPESIVASDTHELEVVK
jgi:parallel beta-helix repeat protein